MTRSAYRNEPSPVPLSILTWNILREGKIRND